jgi:molecular chaperone DnaK
LGEAAYGQSGGGDGGAQGGGAGESASSGNGGAGDGVVDAEFEEVRDDEGKKKSA